MPEEVEVNPASVEVEGSPAGDVEEASGPATAEEPSGPATAEEPARPATAEEPAQVPPARSGVGTTTPSARINLLPAPGSEPAAVDLTVPLRRQYPVPEDDAPEPAEPSSPGATPQPVPDHSGAVRGTAPANAPVRRLTVVDRWRARRHRKRLVQEWAPGATPPPRRTWRWLVVTTVMVLAFGLLFALTVAAVRDLVAL